MADRIREETERELSPYEEAENWLGDDTQFGYRYRDGIYIERDEYRYPEIQEGYSW